MRFTATITTTTTASRRTTTTWFLLLFPFFLSSFSRFSGVDGLAFTTINPTIRRQQQQEQIVHYPQQHQLQPQELFLHPGRRIPTTKTTTTTTTSRLYSAGGAAGKEPSATTTASVATTTEQRMQDMEQVVHNYFRGVSQKDPVLIRSCFAEQATIRDVCALSSSSSSSQTTTTTKTTTTAATKPNPSKTVSANDLTDRCMEFVQAHPDCLVQFYIPPTCLRQPVPSKPFLPPAAASKNDKDDSDETEKEEYWVFAHWYETGTWSGTSRGLEPNHQPMYVEGQTRFRMTRSTTTTNSDDDNNHADWKIQELVVTRTFTEWEQTLLLQS